MWARSGASSPCSWRDAASRRRLAGSCLVIPPLFLLPSPEAVGSWEASWHIIASWALGFINSRFSCPPFTAANSVHRPRAGALRLAGRRLARGARVLPRAARGILCGWRDRAGVGRHLPARLHQRGGPRSPARDGPAPGGCARGGARGAAIAVRLGALRARSVQSQLSDIS